MNTNTKENKNYILRNMVAYIMVSILVIANLCTGYVARADVASDYKTMLDAEKKLKQVQKELAEAKTELNSAQEKAKIAKAKKGQGSYGFFKAYGYTDAMKVLESKEDWVTQFTVIGGDKDATSYDNFKAIIPFLEETNRRRLQEGIDPTTKKKLTELKVSMELIAISEVQTNWSGKNETHSRKYEVSENLAWGYDNPFEGWVDEEKVLWNAALQNKTEYPTLESCSSASSVNRKYPEFYQKVGHYLNIMNANSANMGFAINQYAQWSPMCGQTLRYANVGDEMTVAEFKEKVETYCNSIDATMEKYQTTLSKCKSLGNQEAACDTAYTKAVNTYNKSIQKTGTVVVTEHTKVNNKSKIRKVIVPETVKTIKKNTFKGFKKVKTIEIRTKKLTKKSVANKAFSHFSKKAVAKVPKSKYKAYKKLLKKKGFKGKVKKLK